MFLVSFRLIRTEGSHSADDAVVGVIGMDIRMQLLYYHLREAVPKCVTDEVQRLAAFIHNYPE